MIEKCCYFRINSTLSNQLDGFKENNNNRHIVCRTFLDSMSSQQITKYSGQQNNVEQKFKQIS